MSREKDIKNYYMRVADFAYEPIIIVGTKYIRVAYVHNKGYKSLHLASNLLLVSTTMPPEYVQSYKDTLMRNAELLVDRINTEFTKSI